MNVKSRLCCYTQSTLPCIRLRLGRCSISRRALVVRVYSRGDRFDNEFDRMFDTMSRRQEQELERIFKDVSKMSRDSESVIVPRDSNVEIRKSEQRTRNSYQYYEVVTVTHGAGLNSMRTAQMTNTPFSGFMTALMLAAAAVYAFLTYRFNKNYERSTFQEDKRLKLSLLWPALLISPEFRQKFQKVVNPGSNQTPRSDS